MTSRSLDTTPDEAWSDPRAGTPAGLRRKAVALALHMACLALFIVTVVLPVVGPIASGELARDLQLLQAAWLEWVRTLPLPR